MTGHEWREIDGLLACWLCLEAHGTLAARETCIGSAAEPQSMEAADAYPG